MRIQWKYFNHRAQDQTPLRECRPFFILTSQTLRPATIILLFSSQHINLAPQTLCTWSHKLWSCHQIQNTPFIFLDYTVSTENRQRENLPSERLWSSLWRQTPRLYRALQESSRLPNQILEAFLPFLFQFVDSFFTLVIFNLSSVIILFGMWVCL